MQTYDYWEAIEEAAVAAATAEVPSQWLIDNVHIGDPHEVFDNASAEAWNRGEENVHGGPSIFPDVAKVAKQAFIEEVNIILILEGIDPHRRDE